MLRSVITLSLVWLLINGCTDAQLRLPEGEQSVDAAVIPPPPPVPDAGPGVPDIPEVQAPDDVPTPPDDEGEPLDTPEDVPEVTGPDPLPPRGCTVTVSHPGPGAESVHLAGEMNAWSTTANPLDSQGDGSFSTALDTAALTPGSYAYKLIVNGDQWQLDEVNPLRKYVDGVENSKLIVPDCQVPLLSLESLEVGSASISAVVTVQDGAAAPGIDAASAAVRHGFEAPSANEYDPKSQRFVVTFKDLAPGKHSLVFNVSNSHGPAAPLYLPIWVEDTPWDWRDAVLYFAMTDRFLDGDPAVGQPDACLPDGHPANWAGGDFEGVRQKLADGYFDALGVNTIWLTAVVDNPSGCSAGLLGKQYTSYHGYFPSAQTKVESQLGDLESLRALVAEAHSRGIRVLVDLVANHLHESHPLVSSQQPNGWFHDFISCGGGGFETAPIQCWFEAYLPDLNYTQDDAVEEMTDMALWWVREADLDGFRVDAVKHMHDTFLRTLRYKLEVHIETTPGALFWTVGETFTGDWDGGWGPNETVIKQYINPAMLHGQFDFPLYWRILRVFARDEAAPLHLADYLSQAEGYWGPNAIMSNFLGNHDVPRFISHATKEIGDVWGNGAKEQGWDTPPGQPQSAEPYERLILAWTVLFTTPGVPLIYYGDEVGLPGAGDPDNRRPMVFSGWSASQQAVYAAIGKLAAIRKQSQALRRGSYKTLHTDNDVLAYSRTAVDDTRVVALNRAGTPREVTLNVPAGQWTDALTGQAYASDGSLTLSLPVRGAVILSQ